MRDGKASVHIVRAEAIGNDALDIALSNGNIILLRTELILAQPGFEALAEDDRVLYPKTDGNGIFWRDGPAITMDEIFSLLGRNTTITEESI